MSSEHKKLLCGILQGSILVQILSLLYIKDLVDISDKLQVVIFECILHQERYENDSRRIE